jgi:4-diphosphocytidyl-2-C-methyl-D-erythritol kinase
MIVFPHAKINLGLHIIRKRADGFHELETCFYPVKELHDALEMVPSKNGVSSLKTYNSDWDGPIEQNLVWKAYQFFLEFEPDLEPFDWFLFKKIPSGGGLGGGSSDAVFALRMLAEKAGWKKTDPRLHEIAARLGSDCAFFLHDSPMIGTGRGEVLEPIQPLSFQFRVEFVFPGIHISTAQAFANIQPKEPLKPISAIVKQPISTWKEELVNDFEASVFPIYPELEAIKARLYENGALYASMSGSGSTMFGLFPK